jgi:hypothetical protein
MKVMSECLCNDLCFKRTGNTRRSLYTESDLSPTCRTKTQQDNESRVYKVCVPHGVNSLSEFKGRDRISCHFLVEEVRCAQAGASTSVMRRRSGEDKDGCDSLATFLLSARGVQFALFVDEEGVDAAYVKRVMHGKVARVEGPASEPGDELLSKAGIALSEMPSARRSLQVIFGRRRRKRRNMWRGQNGVGRRDSSGWRKIDGRVCDLATLPVRPTSVAARLAFSQLHLSIA